MSTVRYIVGLSEHPGAIRQLGRESVPVPLEHAATEDDERALCGAPIVAKLPRNFEQSVGRCRSCLEQVSAEL